MLRLKVAIALIVMFDNPNFLVLVLVNLLVIAGILIALRYSPDPNRESNQESLQGDRPNYLQQDRSHEITALKQECLNLRAQLQQQGDRLLSEHRETTFQKLQSLLTQYQSVRQMAQAKPDLSAKNLVALFTPLDNLMQDWEYIPIGEAWQQVPFDPQLHQSDRDDISAGEMVYVRFVGYKTQGDRVLLPAKVSRTLPKITGA
jgi:molecular chaperone GrpE (heat shock protein)